MNTILQPSRTLTLDIYENDDLREWIGMFLYAGRSRNLAAGTSEFYSKKLNAFFWFCQDLAISRVDQITPQTIRQFLIFLEERQHKPGGIHCFYRSVKTFLLWYGQETERTDWRNPIAKVKAPIVPLEPLDPVSVETVRSMIQSCIPGEVTALRDKASLLFLLDTGVRLAEFLALNREDVNLITGAVQIRRGKGRKPRNVYMGDKTRQSVRRYLRERKDYNTALWISTSGERLTQTGVRSMLRRRAARASVPAPLSRSKRNVQKSSV